MHHYFQYFESKFYKSIFNRKRKFEKQFLIFNTIKKKFDSTFNYLFAYVVKCRKPREIKSMKSSVNENS